MSTPRALWLAWGAVVALLAYPAGAQIIGEQSGIMGGDSGFMRPVGGAPAATLTLDAMPYTRTVTCGSYTLTGTFTGSTPTWSASPSGESGSCTDTGGGTFSCVVSVAPDATGEGVETITVTNGATDTETIGFYVAGAHSCFLSQSVDGSYNSTLADLDPVATWENLGSSVLDVTQATAAAQPTFRTSIVGGQPVVRCDGGDIVTASTASDWTFMSNGSANSVEYVYSVTSVATTAQAVVTTKTSLSGSRGIAYRLSAASPQAIVSDGTSNTLIASGGTQTAATFNLLSATMDSAATPDVDADLNGSGAFTGTASAFSALAPASPLNICDHSTSILDWPLTGDLFRVVVYQSALDATQRGINQAVDEWALGGTLPVTP